MIYFGKYTYNTEYIELIHGKGIESDIYIGSFCSIAKGLLIYTGGHHHSDWITTYPFGYINNEKFPNGKREPKKKTKDLIIGSDVWIASRVTIMDKVSNIGHGSIIAANSHVIHDIEPYTIVGGNPAKVIKKRFDDDTIKKLLELKWWDFSDEIINKLIPFLSSDNLLELFNIIKTIEVKK